MFRVPLRRAVHTAASAHPPPRRLALALGASAVAVAYFSWRLTASSQRIALDSAPAATHRPQLAKAPQPAVAPDLSTTPAAPPQHADDAAPSADAAGLDTADAQDADAQDADAAPEGDAAQAGSGGAYNPVTGEINWDCACLGGMAHGTCGPEFREAFSCFVYSEDEPKGINCVEKFKAMQNCFRAHPEEYGEEIMDDDEDDEPAEAVRGDAPVPADAGELAPAVTQEAAESIPTHTTSTGGRS